MLRRSYHIFLITFPPWDLFKEIIHPKIKVFPLCSPWSCSKPLWLPFFCETWRCFEERWSSLTSIVCSQINTNAFLKRKLFWMCQRRSDITSYRHYIQSICIGTLTGHFIRYTLLVTLPFCLQNCLNSSWHRFNKVLETFLRDFGPYWHDSITQLLQICRLHIHDVNLPFHHIPKVLY